MRRNAAPIAQVVLTVLSLGCSEGVVVCRPTTGSTRKERPASDRIGLDRFLEACADGNVSAVAGFVGQDPSLVSATNADGTTALHVARTAAVVRVLLQHGASVDARKPDDGLTAGLTPLHVAAQRIDTDAIDIARILLENGANVNARATTRNNLGAPLEGMTPLSLAVRVLGPVQMIDLLLEHGADPNLAAKGWGSPIDNVRRWGPHGREVLDLMLRYGGTHGASESGEATRSPGDTGKAR